MERAEVEPGGGPKRDIRARREMENFGAVGLLAERRARDDAIRSGVRVDAPLGDALDDPALPEQFADALYHAELARATAKQNLLQHLGRQDAQRADVRRAGERRIASSSFVFFGAHRLRIFAIFAIFARIVSENALGNSRERNLALALRVRQGADADVQAPGGGVFGTRRGVVGSFSCDFFYFFLSAFAARVTLKGVKGAAAVPNHHETHLRHVGYAVDGQSRAMCRVVVARDAVCA